MEKENSDKERELKNILNDDFFTIIKTSKKINDKTKKIDELNEHLIKEPNFFELPDMKSKIPDLYNLLLSNLNENNNNYVLSQMDLIKTLCQHMHKEESFKTFIKLSLPKLFDKFYLQNPKINDSLISMFNKFISFNILNIKDFYQHIENIPLEEEDNYRTNIITFLNEQINNNNTILLSNIPKSIVDIIFKLTKDNENQVSEPALKILDILNKRDEDIRIKQEEEEKKKKEEENAKKEQNEQKEQTINKNENSDNNNDSNSGTLTFVKNIAKAIKKEVQNEESNNVQEKKEEKIESNVNENNNNVNNKNNEKELISKNEETQEKIENNDKNNENKKNNDDLNKEIKNNNNNDKNEEETKPIDNSNNKEDKIEKEETKEDKKKEGEEVKEKKSKKGGGIKRTGIKSQISKFRKNLGKNKKKNDGFEFELVEKKPNGAIETNEINQDDKKTEEEIKIDEKKEEKKVEEKKEEIKVEEKKPEVKKEEIKAEEKKPEVKKEEIKTEENKKEDIKQNEEKKEEIKKEAETKPPENNEKKEETNNEKKEAVNLDEVPIHPSKQPNETSTEKEETKTTNENENNNETNKGDKPLTKKVTIRKSNKKIKKEKKVEEKKVEEKKEEEKKEEEKKEEKKEEENITKNEPTIPVQENKNEETPIENKAETNNEDNPDSEDYKSKPRKSIKIVGVNEKSLNDFEKKLQLALEQEEKERLENKNGNENLTDAKEQKVKQKSEDPKFDNIKSSLGKDIVDSLFSPKWETKKHGFELVNQFVDKTPINNYNISDLIEYLKLKLKNYKETNFNINREAINIYNTMIKKKIIPKDSLLTILITYHDKLSDIKLKDNIVELINNSFDIVDPITVLKQIIAKLTKKNNPKLLIEYSLLLGKIIEEYDIKDLPNKEIIDLCKLMENNSNIQVRTSATNLLCILYKYLGNDVKTLIKDIKESTLKLIEAELEKVTVIDPKTANKKKKVACAGGSEQSKSGGGGGDLIPFSDISKKITPQLLKRLSDGKWPEKKEACENLEKILISANMKILPNGLNNLMTLLKKKLSDSNKNFVKMVVSLLTKLSEALKQGFRQWTKPIALALIPNLADKNQILRNECQACFDKWVENTGFDSLVVHFPQFLKTDNVEMRTEIMNFFKKYKDKFSKSLGDLVYKDMVDPLLLCLQDRSANVRTEAEDIIKSSLKYIPLDNYYKKSKDFKPAIAKDLKQILDKIKRESSNDTTEESSVDTQETPIQKTGSSSNLDSNPKTTIENSASSTKKIVIAAKKSEEHKNKNISKKDNPKVVLNENNNNEGEENEEDQISNFNTVSNSNVTKTKKMDKKPSTLGVKKPKTAIPKKNSSKQQPKRKLSEDDLIGPLGVTMNKQMPLSSVSHLASNSTILRKNDKKSFQKTIPNVKSSGVFLMNVKVIPNKIKRYEKDKKIKFSLDIMSKDAFIKLRETCRGLFTEDFSKKIFSDDFRKQADALKEMKLQLDKKMNVPIYLDNLDIIMKIIGIKLMNNLNPTLMKNFFEFLDSLYIILSENKYKLNDTECNVIISTLIDKLSINNNTLREHLIILLNQYIELMETNKTMVMVLNITLNKNSKIKTDVLDLTFDLSTSQKLNISTKIYAKLLCKFLPINDNTIRTKTLSLFNQIYANVRDELWNWIEVSEKDKEYLKQNLYQDNENEEEEAEEEEEEIKEFNDLNLKEGSTDKNPDNDLEKKTSEKLLSTSNNNNDENHDRISLLTTSNSNSINNNSINEKTSENSNNNSNSIKEKRLSNEITITTPNTNSNNTNNASGYPGVSLTKEDLLETLDNLLSEDQSEQLNTIILIHEIVCSKYNDNKTLLISNIDNIINIFIKVTHSLFYSKDLNTIPIKFAKYLSIVLCKLASNQELISNLSYNVLLELSRELLGYLLINGLDKIGNNQEGNIIFKSINSTMLRILENCDITSVISALLELIKDYYIKDEKNLINLSIKCLLKTTHNLSTKIDSVKIDQVLLQIHVLMLILQKNNNEQNKKTQSNTIIKIVKNIVNELVKLKKEKILEDYSKSVKNHQLNDKYILKWIKASLENLKK